MGVAERAHLINKETGKIEGLSKALKATVSLVWQERV